MSIMDVLPPQSDPNNFAILPILFYLMFFKIIKLHLTMSIYILIYSSKKQIMGITSFWGNAGWPVDEELCSSASFHLHYRQDICPRISWGCQSSSRCHAMRRMLQNTMLIWLIQKIILQKKLNLEMFKVTYWIKSTDLSEETAPPIWVMLKYDISKTCLSVNWPFMKSWGYFLRS